MIEDQVAVTRPPQFHVHQYDPEVDTVDALNEWATALFSPTYSESNPAFSLDANGELHAVVLGTTMFSPVPEGFWLVIGANANISVLSDFDFQSRYELA